MVAMSKFKQLSLSFGALWSLSGAHAYSTRTQEIINKKNRTLSAPSRDITAYQENAVARYQSESKRLSKTDIEGVDNSDPTSPEKAEAADDAESDDKDESRPKSTSSSSILQFSGERVFSVGFVGAGSYGVFGLDFEIGIDDNWAVGGGLGTGMTYSTWDLHGKYYFNNSKRISPFAQFGYANWNMRRVSRSGEKGRPQYLTDRFFADKSGNVTKAQQRHLVYPGVGILLLEGSGLGASAQLIYLISLSNSVGALYGGVGFHLFF